MKRLTPFGIAFRKLRLDKGLRLLDIAIATGRSSSFISAVENGLKPLPPAYVDEIVGVLNLSAQEAECLYDAADRERSAIPVNTLEPSHRAIVGSFARAARSMSPEDLDAVRRFLSKHQEARVASPIQISSNTGQDRAAERADNNSGRIDGEIPFSFGYSHGYDAEPLSCAQIEDLAERMRALLVYPDIERIPIAAALEFGLVRYLDSFALVVNDEAMGANEEGRIVSGTDQVILSEKVYRGALKGNPNDRFIETHELGHFLLHRHRSIIRYFKYTSPIYRDSEWQANFFAGCFLMSRRHAGHFATAREAAARCGLPLDHAEKMMKYFGRTKPTASITDNATSNLRLRRRFVAIFVADVAGFSRLMEIDEEGTFGRLDAVRRRVIDPRVVEHGGEVLKSTGDGVLVTFDSPVEAVRCAVAVQKTMNDQNQNGPQSYNKIFLRIGVHQGDVIVQNNDIYGDDVNIAFRLQENAPCGGVCLSGRVHDLVVTKIDLPYQNMGQLSLRHITKPIQAYSILVTAAHFGCDRYKT